jgi:hypothetical protein
VAPSAPELNKSITVAGSVDMLVLLERRRYPVRAVARCHSRRLRNRRVSVKQRSVFGG